MPRPSGGTPGKQFRTSSSCPVRAPASSVPTRRRLSAQRRLPALASPRSGGVSRSC
ncbi:unnamed protein product [Effrenium voratum]|nr:unnamed protein product [Effrenium voratum]